MGQPDTARSFCSVVPDRPGAGAQRPDVLERPIRPDADSERILFRFRPIYQENTMARGRGHVAIAPA